MSKELHKAILDAENGYYELKDLTSLVCLLLECREIKGSSPESTSSISRLLCLIDDRARDLVKGWTLMHQLAVKEATNATRPD